MEAAQQTHIVVIHEKFDKVGGALASWLSRYVRVDLKVLEPELDTSLPSDVDLVLNLLGTYGWSEASINITQDALSRKIPILIVTEGAKLSSSRNSIVDDVAASFHYRLSSADEVQFRKLLEHIRLRLSNGDVDRIMHNLANGSEDQRIKVLGDLRRGAISKKDALAHRLRQAISGEYAIREAGAGPVRGWLMSALLWCDAAWPDTRALLIQHMSPSYEPDVNVRFLLLANAYQAQLSYFSSMMREAARDNELEVKLLADAIASRSAANADSATLERFRSLLSSLDNDALRITLRVLRYVAIPALVPELVQSMGQRQDDKLSYQFLLAMAHPEIAADAGRRLAQTYGLPDLLRRMLDVLKESNRVTGDRIAPLLSGLKRDAVESALDGLALERPEYKKALTRLLASMDKIGAATVVVEESTLGPKIAGYVSDTVDLQEDQLGIAREVRILTSIMLARAVAPPLAIGLFGNWGTGKSFFMRSMRDAANDLARRSSRRKQAPFCARIVQIEFNAWHYVDSNLWASLVAKILEELATHVAKPTQTPLEQQADLIGDLASAKAATQAAQQDADRAKEQLQQARNSLEVARIKRLEKEGELSSLRAAEVGAMIANDSNLKNLIGGALDKLGLPKTLDSIDDLRSTFDEAYSVGARTTALTHELLEPPNRKTLALLALAVVGIPALAYGVEMALPTVSKSLTTMGAAFGSVAALVSGGAQHLRRGVEAVKGHLARVEEAKKALQDKLGKPSQEETTLVKEVEGAKVAEEEASAKLAASAAREIELRARLKDLEEANSLERFLSDRHKSDDYRKHLGLIATIRSDFESLSRKLQEPLDGAPKVERIVLYIDDLDRCPADKVVDVLQAVHLLLAYKLFVVVVGVDSRWLLHSLTTHYQELGRSGSTLNDDWAASPQHYLEKIFQIPYALRPMDERGYARLIGRLMGGGEQSGPGETTVTAQVPEPEAPPEAASVGAVPADSLSTIEKTQSHDTETVEASVASVAAPDFGATSPDEDDDMDARALVLRPWEISFAERLHRFIPSPRSAKRLANSYRILKARVSHSEEALSAFEGKAEQPGEFQVPLLLMAILIYDPAEAAHWFPALLDAVDGSATVHDAMSKGGDTEVERRKNSGLAEKIAVITALPSFPSNPGLLSEWIPHVARFSFDLSRVNTALLREQPRVTV